jgi:NAD-dependent deacetylase
MNQLAQLIKDSKHILAFTGAGISTESGIPDFRSSSGLYTTGKYEGMSPETILTRRMMLTKPALVLNFYKDRMMKIVEKEPNRAHYALKKLEELGKLDYVITQNIDNLHRKAGSQKVLELHGNGTRWICGIRCGQEYTYEEASRMIAENEKPMCWCQMATIRPDVVMFDESLPDLTFDKAYYACKVCDLIVVVGSSLVVQPACRLVDEIPQTAKLVIINKDTTPYDVKADLLIRESCGQVLEEAVNEM